MAERVVLVVADDRSVQETLTWWLRHCGFQPLTASNSSAASDILRSQRVDAAIVDAETSDGSALDVLGEATELSPAPPVLVLSASSDVRRVVEAMRRGASDVLEKPVDGASVVAHLERCLSTASLSAKPRSPSASTRPPASIVTGAALRDVLAVASRVAATPASSALLLGESGVGKEVIASRIHSMSERRDGPFVRVNLAAIPETMVEAELFGSVRGAYTDSKRDRAGHFASADGGTILLDEICEFKMELQSKLLRALEERRFFPVGSDRERRFNARVLAATNRDPGEMIARGLLYYRVATVTIRVPPLRERPEDILPLAEHFCRSFGEEFGRPNVRIGARGREALLAHAWPGNIRELRNVIERATMLADSDEVTVKDLDLPPMRPSTAVPKAEGALSLEATEREHIARVLREVGGSRVRAAAILGISRSTLWHKAKRFRLP